MPNFIFMGVKEIPIKEGCKHFLRLSAFAHVCLPLLAFSTLRLL